MSKSQKESSDVKILIFVIGAFLIGALAKHIVPRLDIYKEWKQERIERANVIESINLITSVKDNVLNLDINNLSRQNIKDIILSCTYFSESGTELGSDNFTIFINLYKDEFRRVNGTGIADLPLQAATGKCTVEGFTQMNKVD